MTLKEKGLKDQFGFFYFNNQLLSSMWYKMKSILKLGPFCVINTSALLVTVIP